MTTGKSLKTAWSPCASDYPFVCIYQNQTIVTICLSESELLLLCVCACRFYNLIVSTGQWSIWSVPFNVQLSRDFYDIHNVYTGSPSLFPLSKMAGCQIHYLKIRRNFFCCKFHFIYYVISHFIFHSTIFSFWKIHRVNVMTHTWYARGSLKCIVSSYYSALEYWYWY